MSYDPGSVLQEAMENLPCCIELPSYNDAVSLKAKITRYIKSFDGDSALPNPFGNLEITVLRSGILRFAQRRELKAWQPPHLTTE